MTKQRLELTWFNKDLALIPTQQGKYGYTWVDPADPRYCETRTLVLDEYVQGTQSEKSNSVVYSDRADLTPMTDNLLVLGEAGDTLEALTRVPELAAKYLGQVKLIYIDPPFNTEQTFEHYEDNLEHSIWLTMMRDRLLHMRRLLRRDGSIWVHLDYAENHRMRVLLDEVFGADSFLAEVVWQKADSPRRGAGFSVDQDVILVYRVSDEFVPNLSARTEADNVRFKNPDDDPRGPWWDDNPTGNHGDGSGGMCYAIQNPLTGEMMRPGIGRNWVLSQKRILAALNGWVPYRLENLHDAEYRAGHEGVPVEKASDNVCALVLDVPLEEAQALVSQRRLDGSWPEVLIRSKGSLGLKSYVPESGNNPRTWWTNAEVGHNRAAKSELKALFPGRTAFSTPKPERLLERVLQIGSQPGDLVMDVFAGSGTTAAVAQKMGRRWVAVELVEPTMSRFTRPRLERVVNDEDSGGITRTGGERVSARDVELPGDMGPEDAQRFTSLLNTVIAEHPELKKSAQVKALKALTKTAKSKDTVNWRGGGGFQVAHLAPQCFDYDEDLDRVVLTEHATGQLLVESIAANLGFTLEMDDLYYDGSRGRTLLKVHEGVLDLDTADELLAHLDADEKLVIAATGVVDGVREHLRQRGKGSRVVHIPDDIFRYSKDNEQ
ncbi:site-specific DNA-methyltransferase [Corynebacterium variabile]|uniref:site-specific DNA-methyltransferase n=1 Tax=Corynebacterium variabile TaxID=1727 RepID=UPI002FE1084C